MHVEVINDYENAKPRTSCPMAAGQPACIIAAVERTCVDVPLTPHQAKILPATHRQVS